MNLTQRTREEPEINLTSLIDVVLLLLVFFMVSTSFVREAEISIRLPEATAEPVQNPMAEVLEIGITATGNYLINGRALVNSDQRTLRAAIERIMGERRDVPVVIRSDADSNVQALATAMSTAGDLGFVEINIATVSASDTQ